MGEDDSLVPDLVGEEALTPQGLPRARCYFKQHVEVDLLGRLLLCEGDKEPLHHH